MLEEMPEGAVRFEYGKPGFGVADMVHQEVYHRSGAAGSKFIEGTTLRFAPGEIQVNLKRQDLTGAKINRIGELVRAIHDATVIDQYLSVVKKEAELPVTELRTFIRTSPDVTSQTPFEEIQARARKILEEETGITAALLEERQNTLKEKLAALNEEAHSLGILHIARHDKGWGYSVTPPEEPAEIPLG